jgi:hypothetical protein
MKRTKLVPVGPFARETLILRRRGQHWAKKEFAELQNGARLHGRPKSDALPSALPAVVGEHSAFARMRGRRGNSRALPVQPSMQQKKQVGGKLWGEPAGGDASDWCP